MDLVTQITDLNSGKFLLKVIYILKFLPKQQC